MKFENESFLSKVKGPMELVEVAFVQPGMSIVHINKEIFFQTNFTQDFTKLAGLLQGG